MNTSEARHQHIIEQLKQVGVSDFSLHKQTVKQLPSILRDDEKILAALVGRNTKRWSAMLVATDSRIVYVEADLLFHSFDELLFGVVSGIEVRPTPILSSLTLFTRIGDYTVTTPSSHAADTFRRTVEHLISL